MSLTGVPLVVGAALAAVAALAGTVVVWHRWGAWRLLTRPVGILLTEALVLVSVGLVVNRSEQFYPTWQSLFEAGYTGGTSYATAPGGLDAWLAAQPSAGTGQAVAFTWRQAGWPDWGLAAPPTVVVPAGYLRQKGLRYPVIVVLDGVATGTQGADKAGPAVVVFAHPTPSAKAAVLAADLANAVSGALRVTPYRWVVVADAAQAALGAGAVDAVPARYSALAQLCPTAGRCARRSLPAGIPGTMLTGALPAALAWAARELPPPLAASTPPPAYLPPPKHRPHPGASTSVPLVAQSPFGRTRVTG